MKSLFYFLHFLIVLQGCHSTLLPNKASMSMLPPYEVYSSEEPAKKIVVLLHGWDEHGKSWKDTISLMKLYLPHYHFISLHGVEECDMGRPGQRQWFSFQPLLGIAFWKNGFNILFHQGSIVKNILSGASPEHEIKNRIEYLMNQLPEPETQQLIQNNVTSITNIIKAKQNELNLTNQDTVIIGFSQGTIMGLYLTLIAKESFLCTIGFSGLLLPPLDQRINKNTPICLIHGEEDNIISVNKMDHAVKYLNQHSIPNFSYRLPGIKHYLNREGIQYAINFIKQCEKLSPCPF